MTDLVTTALVLAGAAFMLVAALGLVRMPDLLMRMHAATKAGTLGAALLMLAVTVAYEDAGVTVRALATVTFLFLTAPISAHVIGRAAYRSGTAHLWHNTGLDELADDRRRERPAPQVDDRS